MILCINDYDGLYSQFWAHLGGETTGNSEILFRDPGSVKLVGFVGGEDVSPELYAHKNIASNSSRHRDEREVLIFEQAQKHRIPMTGICRGSQFLNVMCGGTMVQDMTMNHGGSCHQCITYDGQEFEVTSSHHQMSVLGKGGKLLAWAEESLPLGVLAYDGDIRKALAYTTGGEEPVKGAYAEVTEAFVYPEERVFAVQHHPEWQNVEEAAPQWTLAQIARHCWGQKDAQMPLRELAAFAEA